MVKTLLRGFFYYPSTHEVCLRQNSASSNQSDKPVSRYCFPIDEEIDLNKEPQIIFLQKCKNLLNQKNIQPLLVYDYFDEEKKIKVYVFYAELKQKYVSLKPKTPYIWIPLKKVSSKNINPAIAHDLLIGQRVIEDRLRKKQKK